MLSPAKVCPGQGDGLVFPVLTDDPQQQQQQQQQQLCLPAVVRRPEPRRWDATRHHAPAPPSSGLLLATPQPRNMHLVPRVELNTHIDRASSVQQQLRSFCSSHPDAFIPQEVLVPLMLEDLSDTAAVAARAHRGNRVAACTVVAAGAQGGACGAQTLLFSCCGQIGEEVVMSTLGRHPTPDGHTTWQVGGMTRLSLGKEVLQLDVQPAMTLTHPGPGNTPCNGGGVWVVARCNTRVDVLYASQVMNDVMATQGPAPPAAWQLEWRGSLHPPHPPAHVALHASLPECAVLLADGRPALLSLAACGAVQGGELTAPLPLACVVPLGEEELGRVRRQSGGGTGGGGRGEAKMMHLTCAWGLHPRTLLLGVQQCLWRCDLRVTPQGALTTSPTLLHRLQNGETFLALATPPRAHHLTALIPPQPALHPHNTHLGPPHNHPGPSSHGPVPAGDAPHPHDPHGGGVGGQQVAEEDVGRLLPYVAALTSSRLVLLDLRRPHTHVLEAPHACTTAPPTWLTFTPVTPTSSPVTHGAALHGSTGQQHSGGGHEGEMELGSPGSAPGSLRPSTAAATQQGEGVVAGAAPHHVRGLVPPTQASQMFPPVLPPAVTPDTRAGGSSGRDAGTGPASSELVRLHGSSHGLLSWGCEAGCVHCLEVLVTPSGVQLVLDPGTGEGGPDGTDVGSSQEGHAAQRAQILVWPNLTRAGRGSGGEQGGAGAVEEEEGVAEAGGGGGVGGEGWRPSCCDWVRSWGLVQRLCDVGSAGRDCRLASVRRDRARLHSSSSSSSSGGVGSQGGEAGGEARHWGHQGDRDALAAGRVRAHLEAARAAPDMQGLAVLPVWPFAWPTQALLLRSTFDGDVALTALTPQPLGQEGTEVDRRAAALAGVEPPGSVGEAEAVQLQESGQDLAPLLTARYTGARHAARMIMGNQTDPGDRQQEVRLPRHHAYLAAITHHNPSFPHAPAALQAPGDQPQQPGAGAPLSSHDWRLHHPTEPHSSSHQGTAPLHHQLLHLPHVTHEAHVTHVQGGGDMPPPPPAVPQQQDVQLLAHLLANMQVPLTAATCIMRISPAWRPAPTSANPPTNGRSSRKQPKRTATTRSSAPSGNAPIASLDQVALLPAGVGPLVLGAHDPGLSTAVGSTGRSTVELGLRLVAPRAATHLTAATATLNAPHHPPAGGAAERPDREEEDGEGEGQVVGSEAGARQAVICLAPGLEGGGGVMAPGDPLQPVRAALQQLQTGSRPGAEAALPAPVLMRSCAVPVRMTRPLEHAAPSDIPDARPPGGADEGAPALLAGPPALSAATQTALQAHATVLLRAEHLQPRSTQVCLAHDPAAALPTATQQRKQQLEGGAAQQPTVWRLELSAPALQCYTSLLDAWPAAADQGVEDDALFVSGRAHCEQQMQAATAAAAGEARPQLARPALGQAPAAGVSQAVGSRPAQPAARPAAPGRLVPPVQPLAWRPGAAPMASQPAGPSRSQADAGSQQGEGLAAAQAGPSSPGAAALPQPAGVPVRRRVTEPLLPGGVRTPATQVQPQSDVSRPLPQTSPSAARKRRLSQSEGF